MNAGKARCRAFPARLLPFFPVLCQSVLNPLIGIDEIADGDVVVERVDKIGNVFAQIAVHVPLPAQKIRRLINQICGQDPVDFPVLKSLIEPVQSAGEQAEGGADKNFSRAAIF